MREGWLGDEYLILFDGAEVEALSVAYLIRQSLPGHKVLGLKTWDHFIVQSETGCVFTIPTVPLDPKYLATFELPDTSECLLPDQRFTGKIQWLQTPLLFGGALSPENEMWVSIETHAQLVHFWNDVYRSIAPRAI